MRVTKMHRLLRILFVFGAASILLACPEESSSSDDGNPFGGSAIDISTLTLSYTNIRGLAEEAIQDVSPTWTGGGMPEVTYTIEPALPANLSINEGSGVISGTPEAVQAATEYTITATGVSPSYTGTQTATVTITVVDNKTNLSTFTTFSYEAIAGIENVVLTGTGPAWGEADAPTATYTIEPALPAGLSINGSGVISGTPKTAQAATDYTITATGTIAYEGTKTATVSITIQAQIELSTLTFSYANIRAVENVALTATSPVWTDGNNAAVTPTATYTIEPALPAGLSIDEGSGVISGTPDPDTAQAATDYTVTATAASGQLYKNAHTATVSIAVSINVDALFARWKASESYAAITEATTDTAIGTVDELKNISNNLAGTYYLTSNIDVSGAAWEPLGSTTAPFTGTFNGNGYIIYGLKIEATSTDAGDNGKYQGLFASVNNATVKDVGVGVELISAVDSVGAVAGEAKGTSSITNVAVAPMADTAEITATTPPQNVANAADVTGVGGLVGIISGTTEVSNAYNLEMVVASSVAGDSSISNVGGLVGRATSANKIHGYTFTGEDSTATIISGQSYIGGLAGSVAANAEVRGSVSGAGEIKGTSKVGGLVGEGNDGSIIRGYFDGGTVNGHTNQLGYVGGLVGGFRNGNNNTVTGYVANATITGIANVGGLVGWAYTGTISGSVTDTTITTTGSTASDGNSAGGLVGQMYNSDRTFLSGYVVNTAEDSISVAGRNAGGIVGRVVTAAALTGNGKIAGYVSTSVTSTKEAATAGAFAGSGAFAMSIAGYWDESAVGIVDNNLQGGTAISAIANIAYDGSTTYTDSGKANAEVFNNTDFLTQFSVPGAAATPPTLRPYRILPFGITLSVGNTVNLSGIAPWDDNTETVTWSSSATGIVSVTNAGVATAVAAGSATITATWTGNTATMAITVQ